MFEASPQPWLVATCVEANSNSSPGHFAGKPGVITCGNPYTADRSAYLFRGTEDAISPSSRGNGSRKLPRIKPAPHIVDKNYAGAGAQSRGYSLPPFVIVAALTHRFD